MIGIVGLGYVGITSALCFHSLGEEIIGCDINKKLIDGLSKGNLHIHDEKLLKYFSKNFTKFTFSDDINLMNDLEDVFICVPTESKVGSLDLTIVKEVLKKLDNLNVKNIWIRSTIDDPNVFSILKTNRSKIFSFPEFLREGKCWDDFFDPPIMLLGGENIRQTKIYNILNKKLKKPEISTVEEAITVKIACNSFHSLKVVFANEMRNISWNNKIDINKVMDIFIKDTKLNISSAYLKPGLPFGGPCLPKDTLALSKSIDSKNNLFKTVIDRNNDLKVQYYNSILNLGYKKVGFYGLEFKPNTGDLRNSPIIDIIKLVSQKIDVFVYDKFMIEKTEFENVNIVDSINSLQAKSEVIITYYRDNNLNYIHWDQIKIKN